MTIMKIIDGLYFTIGMMLFNPLTCEGKTPDQLNEDDRTTYDACMGAIALLKAQEPRVMTWHDVIGAAIECKPLYIEVKDSEDKEPGDDRWAMVTQYKDSITNGMIRAMSSYVTSEVLFAEDYCKRWRCWTSRPDQATREATPWE